MMLQNGDISNASEILDFVMKRAGPNMKYDGGGRRREHEWFDKECKQRQRATREALQAFRSRNDELSRINYWDRSKNYEKLVES
jgi:hypothetical protein